jgi:alginate O-acetyltransferase complex protein AlgJ
MKKKIYTFIVLSLIILAIAPAINIRNILMSGKAMPTGLSKWKGELYSMDFALPYLGRAYYALGISFSPEQVIIGKENWLFLGDEFAKTVTERRNGATEKDTKLIKKVIDSASAWNDWYIKKGVDSYRILIGPDKGAIYSEQLPEWAAPAKKSITDAIVDLGSPSIFVYPKTKLLSIKSSSSFDLYYKTDTHWNALGAWIAFDELAKSFEESDPGLTFPEKPKLDGFNGRTRIGGDLAKFLRISEQLEDIEISLNSQTIKSITIKQYNYSDINLISSGKNEPIGAPLSPLLVISDAAMNKKKVLWLRDSFGSSVSPFMSATFSEVLHVHHGRVDSKAVADLVKKFNPDYVIVTCVERNAHGGFMISTPPADL